MKPKFRFEIQNCITVEVQGEDAEHARSKLIDNLEDYAEQMINDCYISDGKKVE